VLVLVDHEIPQIHVNHAMLWMPIAWFIEESQSVVNSISNALVFYVI